MFSAPLLNSLKLPFRSASPPADRVLYFESSAGLEVTWACDGIPVNGSRAPRKHGWLSLPTQRHQVQVLTPCSKLKQADRMEFACQWGVFSVLNCLGFFSLS